MKATLKSQKFSSFEEAKQLMAKLSRKSLEHTCICDGYQHFVLWAQIEEVNPRPKTYRIVDGDNNVIDELTGLTLDKAEQQLCRQLNLDVDCYIQDESEVVA